jgi:hypothetical protein
MEREENEAHFCYECDSEFIVTTPYDNEQMISFCPFCGSEMDGIDEEFADEDEDDN